MSEELNGEIKRFYVKWKGDDVNRLVGRLKTIVDASITEEGKCKAMKDLVGEAVWSWIEKQEESPFYYSDGTAFNDISDCAKVSIEK